MDISPAVEDSAWTVRDFPDRGAYTVEVSAAEIEELEAFNAGMTAQRKTIDDLDAADFDCPLLKRRMSDIYEELKSGRGFVVQSGLPVDRWSLEDSERAYWGMGCCLGEGLSQSVLGDRLGYVRDVTREDPHARAYRNRTELSPHTDLADMFALFCIKSARTGGVSLLSSALAVHNRLLETAPDLLQRLYEGFHYHRKGEEGPGEAPVTPYKVPVFSNTDGRISGRFVKTYVELGQEAIGEPLGASELAAIDALMEAANSDDLQLRFTLQPGQILWSNNLTMFHSRTGFEDFEDPDERRLLLRLWLENEDLRPQSRAMRLYEGGAGIRAQAGRTPSFDNAGTLAAFRAANREA